MGYGFSHGDLVQVKHIIVNGMRTRSRKSIGIYDRCVNYNNDVGGATTHHWIFVDGNGVRVWEDKNLKLVQECP